jgi:hypothetical protein
MIIQTNPEMFSRVLPVHTVTNIDRGMGTVTLSGSDGSSYVAQLAWWGDTEVTQPAIGSQVQLLPDE